MAKLQLKHRNEMGELCEKRNIILLCSWAYVSCQYNVHVHFQLKTKSMQSAALFLKMGKWL